jgi:PhzF family phenazine biosynthesis protein
MHADADYYARQFNPAAGIDEDPITGIAAGALGAYVQRYRLTNKTHILVEQGYAMSMGGEMYVDTSDGIRVGGYAVSFGKHTVDV